MKKRTLWVGLSFLLVASLVLASCAEEVVEEPVVEEPVVEEPVVEEPVVEEPVVEEPVAGAPQYGGTITVFYIWSGGTTPPEADHSKWIPGVWLGPIYDRPLAGDIEQYGPAGTGEYDFANWKMIPEEFLRGHLIEDWEVYPDRLVWHVRPGIMWQDNPYLGFDFEPRELTAQDMADNIIRTASVGYCIQWGMGTIIFGDMDPEDIALTGDERVYATSRYSLVIEWEGFDPLWKHYLGYEDGQYVIPPEVFDSKRWDHQVGTGPWMFKEYEVGSHMTYVRNPNYWETTTIDGVVYDIPFIDEMIAPIIPDEATQMAALRTGRLDWYAAVPVKHWDHLDETAPGILSRKTAPGIGRGIQFMCNQPPFDSREVRRALVIGTDKRAVADLLGVGPLPLHYYPLYYGLPETLYTPLEKLPPSTRLLYDYNPELAIEMLADAGYPEGFSMKYYTDVAPLHLEVAALLSGMWDKIDIEIEIISEDTHIWQERVEQNDYTGVIYDYSDSHGFVSPFHIEGLGDYGLWSGEYADRFDELIAQAKALTDEADYDEQCALFKEAAVIMVDDCRIIPIMPMVEGWYWWPWVVDYYRCNFDGDNHYIGPVRYMWLDPDLKAEMGF